MTGAIIVTANLQARKRRHRAATQTGAELRFALRTGGTPEFSAPSPQTSPPLFDWEAPLLGLQRRWDPIRVLEKGQGCYCFWRVASNKWDLERQREGKGMPFGPGVSSDPRRLMGSQLASICPVTSPPLPVSEASPLRPQGGWWVVWSPWWLWRAA